VSATAEDAQGISITSADEPEAIVLDLEGPLQPDGALSEDAVGRSREGGEQEISSARAFVG